MRAGLFALFLTVTTMVGGCSQGPEDPPVTTSPTPSDTVTPGSPSPSPSTLAEAKAVAEKAVARVTTTSWATYVEDEDTGELFDACLVGTGTAFAVQPNLLLTAAHVVEDSDRIRVTFDGVTTPGEVVGYDRDKDLALVRIERETPGLVALAERSARVGDEVATLGYAEGLGLSYLSGNVNRVNRKTDVDGHFMTGLTEVDFAAKPGNSGGPVFDSSGDVVGIHVAGLRGDAGGRLVVPSTTAAPLVDDWRAEPDTGDLEATPCPILPGMANEAGPQDDEANEYPALVHSAALTVRSYVQGINNGDYGTAYAQLADGPDFDDFVDGVETSQISGLEFEVVESSQRPVLDIDFTTEQKQGEGPEDRPDEECTWWHLRYTFEARDDIWLIDKVRAQPGESANEPCFEGDAD